MHVCTGILYICIWNKLKQKLQSHLLEKQCTHMRLKRDLKTVFLLSRWLLRRKLYWKLFCQERVCEVPQTCLQDFETDTFCPLKSTCISNQIRGHVLYHCHSQVKLLVWSIYLKKGPNLEKIRTQMKLRDHHLKLF